MATEKRLIDANVLGRDAFHIKQFGKGVRCVVDWDDIEAAPTADAVEVVRCRECKYWKEGRHHTGRCDALVQFHDAERYLTDAGHFCSYGERKRKDAE